ncbi:hypothetical protein LCGC14_1354660 [marine sediment metagenome]|uniref:Uncharacterized protein n=1 Tax=marine sediment metagenome TaxID=412755 RepID=A0A0F9NC66_9ZZZZ
MSRLSDKLLALSAFRRPPFKPIPFGKWGPDLPDYANPGATVATNVIGAKASYRPAQDLVVQSDALVDRARGAIAASDSSGNAFFYAGDETALYQIRNQTVTEKSGATYATAATDNWEFVEFNGVIIATNYTNPIQGLAVGGGGNFADHLTSTLKPKARHIGIWRDFVVIGNTVDGTDGTKPNRVWWSGIRDAVDFDPDATTQSDFQDIADGGEVTRIVDGVEYGIAFQERMIQRVTYVGSPLIFDFHPIDRRRGSPVPGSIIPYGRFTFFWTEEGFFYNDGSQSYPIGSDQVDRTFRNQFDLTNAHFMSGAVDPVNKTVVWAFPGAESTAGAPNKLYVYYWPEQKWSEVDIDTEIIVRALTQGFSLEDLDSLTTDIDDGTLESFDSPTYQGGVNRFAAFDPNHRLAYFTGDNLAATLETGEFQITPGRRSLLNKARSLIDGGTISMAVAGREKLTDSVTFGSAASMNGSGEFSLRKDARYHRLRCTIAAGGDWQHCQGVEHDGKARGRR